MFRRFLKGNNNNNSNAQKGKKKRLSPTTTTTTSGGTATAPGVTTTNSIDSMASSAPGYQYALNEYAQTVEPTSSNDDGLQRRSKSSSKTDNNNIIQTSTGESDAILHGRDAGYVEISASLEEMQTADSMEFFNSSTFSPSAASGTAGSQSPRFLLSAASTASRLQDIEEGNDEDNHSASTGANNNHTTNNIGGANAATFGIGNAIAGAASAYSPPPLPTESSFPYHGRTNLPPSSTHRFAEAVYEEWYGDAYLGGPIRYIYPSGYQSMRPRGGPWKLSIIVCLLFTWLSVFIIGHCSDRADQQYADYYNEDGLDDDKLVIERRWCGSELLYMMWVVSMLITGLAAAYCSVIGYIKVRDFAVANSRSQPPGWVGKSDYYVQLHDQNHAPDGRLPPVHRHHHQDGHHEYYQRSIYQSDGSPQFWGGHIYRPTQAAVAITSR